MTARLSIRATIRISREHLGIDLALDMLRNPDYPGLAWSIVNYDATTIWEKFCLDRELREDRSLDHHAMNHPSAWLLTHLAGIQVTHRRIVLRPHIPKDLDWAKTSVGTLRGTIESSWKKENGNGVWNVVVPPNRTAEAVFPGASGKQPQTLPSGKHRFEWKQRDTRASCNHGFASCLCLLLDRLKDKVSSGLA